MPSPHLTMTVVGCHKGRSRRHAHEIVIALCLARLVLGSWQEGALNQARCSCSNSSTDAFHTPMHPINGQSIPKAGTIGPIVQRRTRHGQGGRKFNTPQPLERIILVVSGNAVQMEHVLGIPFYQLINPMSKIQQQYIDVRVIPTINKRSNHVVGFVQLLQLLDGSNIVLKSKRESACSPSLWISDDKRATSTN